MRCKFGPEVRASEQQVVRAALGRFPQDLTVLVFHPEPERWTVWFGGFYLVDLLTEGKPLEALADEITDQAYRALRLMEDVVINPETPDLFAEQPTLDEMVKLRLSDFERTMGPSEIQEKAERGKLAGLEFLKQKVRQRGIGPKSAPFFEKVS
jgi:hypothetical protein